MEPPTLLTNASNRVAPAMQQLVLVLVFVAFAISAPIKVTALCATLLLLITLTVVAVTHAVAGVSTTVSSAFKAVFLSLCFLAIWLLTLLSYVKGSGSASFHDLSLLMLLASLFGAFVMGFKVALPLSFSSSAIVAVLSAGISGALIWGARSYL